MDVVKRTLAINGDRYIEWRCPGCGRLHNIPVTGAHAWGFNGDLAKPTLHPSVLEWVEPFSDPEDPKFHIPGYRCHFFLRDGVVEFLADCTHENRNRHMPLNPIEESS